MCDKSYVIYQGSDDWSALYEDGKLVRVSDHYLIEEELHSRLGIEVVQSDDFLRGGNQRANAASTLTELQAYSDERQACEAEAAALEAQAAELRRRAATLTGK